MFGKEHIMNQRPGKTHAAALRDGDRIALRDLVDFVREAKVDLESEGDSDAALRFELFEEYLCNDFTGGKLKYKPGIIGL